MYKLTCCLAVAGAGLGGQAVAGIINVPADQPTIQAGIDAAVNGDEVVVALGTYFETINFLGKAIWLRSSGGPEVTIIDAQQLGSVVTCDNGEGPDTVLEGFTITGGSGTPCGFFGTCGGGMFNENSSPTVTNCTFSGNMAADFGGGMFNGSSNPTVTGCTFIGDTTDFRGGGIALFGSTLTVTDSAFIANSTPVINQRGGGAIWNQDSHTTLVNCELRNNQGYHGGAIASAKFFVTEASLTLIDCSFSGNFADVGGAVFNQNIDATVISCAFVANEAAGDIGFGGGMLNLSSASSVMVNSLMAGNVAGGDGGGLCNIGNSTFLAVNATITANTSALSGGGIFIGSGSGLVRNSILWANSDTGGQDESAQIHADGPVSVDFSCIQGLTGDFLSAGNISSDPLFADPEGPDDDPDTFEDNDYRLSTGSPCIDAGENTAVPEGIDTDLDGNPRFVDDPSTPDTGNGTPPVVDMGAYEFQGTPCPWDLDSDGNVFVTDLLLLLGDFGSCDGSPADFDGDGCVTFHDLFELLHNLGHCP